MISSDERRHLFGTGFAMPIEGMKFNPDKDYRACLICGAVYQSWLDRNYQALPVGPLKQKLAARAKEQRGNWAVKHAGTHSIYEHELLKKSGLSMTPEAAKKLAAFGLLPLSDMMIDYLIMGGETTAALRESVPIPITDVEE